MIAFILGRWRGYSIGFAALLVGGVMPGHFDRDQTRISEPTTLEHSSEDHGGLPRAYWLYLLGAALIGFVDFSLIAFHFNKAGTLSKNWVPIA